MQSLPSKNWVAAGVGLLGAGFIGYCVYFDHKRRSDPGFKQKLREKRAKAAANKQKSGASSSRQSAMPDISNQQEMQAFFLQEVQLGEELLGEGDIENGVEHLANAIAMCGQPQQLLQILQQTLPPQVFGLLIQRLAKMNPRGGMRDLGASGDTGGPEVSMIPDAELE